MKGLLWKKVSQKVVYSGYRKINQKRFLLPDGSNHDFDILDGEDAAVVVAVTKSGKILVVSQFRPGTEEILDDLPGGVMSRDEKPLAAMKRELLEETGYCGELKLVAKCIASAYRDSYLYCFVATNCHKIAKPMLDKTEFIKVKEKSVKEFVRQVRKGKISDTGAAMIGLDYLGLLK